jgi:hypothetical protein
VVDNRLWRPCVRNSACGAWRGEPWCACILSCERRRHFWALMLAHAQQHFLSVLRNIKETLDEFHGVPADDPAFGRRWSSKAVVRAAALLTLLTPYHENTACRVSFCGTLFT